MVTLSVEFVDAVRRAFCAGVALAYEDRTVGRNVNIVWRVEKVFVFTAALSAQRH